MSGEKIILDTNILLYYLNGDKKVNPFFEFHEPAISFISELEALSAPELTPGQKQKVLLLLDDTFIHPYKEELKDLIIGIRSQKKLKLPDAIIAATAMLLKLPLVTGDKAFKNITGLDIILHEPTIS